MLGSKFISNIVSPSSPLLWTFYVAPSDSGAVTLRWNITDIQNVVPPNVTLTLRDNVNNNIVNLRMIGSYSFSSASSSSFTIMGAVTPVSTDQGIPSSFALAQNYPDPFNPTTTIRYALPQRSQVTLAIYNMLGQKIAELVNTEKEAGTHEVTFNAAGLASGVYLYRLQAGTYVQTKKFVLVR